MYGRILFNFSISVSSSTTLSIHLLCIFFSFNNSCRIRIKLGNTDMYCTNRAREAKRTHYKLWLTLWHSRHYSRGLYVVIRVDKGLCTSSQAEVARSYCLGTFQPLGGWETLHSFIQLIYHRSWSFSPATYRPATPTTNGNCFFWGLDRIQIGCRP